MVLAGGDGHDAHGQQRRNRLGCAVRGAAVLAVAERALLPEAPAEHRAARAQGEAVVRAKLDELHEEITVSLSNLADSL